MKWFKHISDSLDDPFIFDLIQRFGGDGYLVFFGVIEIYSREFKTEDNWKLVVTKEYLKQKLHKRQWSIIGNILYHINLSGKWSVSCDFDFKNETHNKLVTNSQQTRDKLVDNSHDTQKNSNKTRPNLNETRNNNQVTIFIPKFHEMMDEYSQRKIGIKSGASPKNVGADKEEDKEEEVEIKDMPSGGFAQEFLNFYEAYPKKVGRKSSWEIWKKMKKRPKLETLLSALEKQKRAKEHLRQTGQFVSEWPDPERWLKKERWNDEIEQTCKTTATPKAHIESVFVFCPHCRREVAHDDLVDDKHCVHCAPRKPLNELLEKIGRRI